MSHPPHDPPDLPHEDPFDPDAAPPDSAHRADPPDPPDPADLHSNPAYGSHDPGTQIHIAGAGGIGMFLLLVSLSMLFIASMLALLYIRSQSTTWPPPGMPRIPRSLWLSTFVILAASYTVQKAHAAIRRDQEKKLVAFLTATFVAGVLFLIVQTLNWAEFYGEIRRSTTLEGAYLGMFYVLTGLHAAHVVGGLIPLGVVLSRAKQGRYSRNFHPGVRYVSVYWHFLDVIWILLFCLIYF